MTARIFEGGPGQPMAVAISGSETGKPAHPVGAEADGASGDDQRWVLQGLAGPSWGPYFLDSFACVRDGSRPS